MYKHTAESILESTDKRFISQVDKDKYDGYNDRFREKTDTYTKQQLENVVMEFDNIIEPVSGPNISIEGTIDGYMRNVEILGNTIQNPNNLKDIRSVGIELEDGRYEIPLLIRGKNLLPPETREGYYNDVTGEFVEGGKIEEGLVIVANINPIPCIPNTTYTFNKTFMGRTLFYNNKGEYIGNIVNNSEGNPTTFTTPENCIYINMHTDKSFKDVSLVVGNNVEEYTPFVKEELISIIIDNPLERVNKVRDRIIKKDGVWGVEKSIGYITLDGYNMPEWALIKSDEEGNDTVVAHTEKNTYKSIYLNECISDLLEPLNTIWFENRDCFTVSEDGRLYVRLSKSKLETFDSFGINDYFKENKMEIKFVLSEPEFIPLPDNQQIMLKILEEYTNIDLITEVPGIIKGEICRTLDSSVISSNEIINDKIKDVSKLNRLEDMTSTKVETNNQFISVEKTSSGYLEDIVLEGETLVNMIKSQSKFEINKEDTMCYNEISLLKPLTVGKVYTYIPLNVPSYMYTLYLGKYDSTNILIIGGEVKPRSFVAQIDCDGVQLSPHFYSKTSIRVNDIENIKLLLLEGDYTDKPLSFFEGLKSVGEDVENVQVITSNDNFFDSDLLPKERLEDDGYYHFRTDTANSSSRFFFGFITHDKKNIIDNIDYNTVVDYNSYNLTNGWLLLGINGDAKDDKITIPVSKLSIPRTKLYKGIVCEKITNDHFRIKDVSLTTNLKGEFTNYKSDKKELLYLDIDSEWKKPILRKVNERVKDIIKKHSDGKYYLHKHCEENVINGDLPWQKHTAIQDDETYCYFIAHVVSNINHFNADEINLKCDIFKFTSRRALQNIEGNAICVNNGTGSLFYYGLKIKKSLLSTPDADGLKAYLNVNNATVVHECDEVVYECTPIDLLSYDDMTNIVVDSGAINPKLLVKVNNNISSVINSVKNKISILESDFYDYVIDQNKSMLDSNYGVDSVNLKVDILTKSQELIQNEMDYDIYELMYKNIMIGKYNYNREKMEEIIDFYTMVDKISLEMASALFELIEKQHFEPEE